MEDGRVQPTTLRPTIVDGTSLTVVKDTSPRQILEVPVPILLDNEEIVRETKPCYPDDI